MPAKITIKTAGILKSLEGTRTEFNAVVADQVGDQINRLIKAGTSPVEGQKRFTDYAESYKRQIEAEDGAIRGTDGNLWEGKRLRPVNLTVSGRMLKSQEVKLSGVGVKVSYTAKEAEYHNSGTDKIPRRAMLPLEPGEKFSRVIMTFLNATVVKLLRDRLNGQKNS